MNVHNPYIIDANGQHVYVLAYNTLAMTSGGFDWYHTDEAALEAFQQEQDQSSFMSQQVMLVPVVVDKNQSNDKITDLIDAQLNEIMVHDSASSYPLTVQAWKDYLELNEKDGCIISKKWYINRTNQGEK